MTRVQLKLVRRFMFLDYVASEANITESRLMEIMTGSVMSVHEHAILNKVLT
jgi:hypothetical protein